MSGPPPGSYEDIPASLALVLPLPFLWLYIVNRNCFPIAQREPWLALFANSANGFMIMSWMFEQAHPQLPLLEREISTPICFGLVLATYLVRVWKLYMDVGLANERVQGKPGWFIKHRHYRERRFLFKMLGCLAVIHFIQLIVAVTGDTPDDFHPARAGQRLVIATFIGIAINLFYFFTFIVFSCLIAGKTDGFYLKQEFRLVGCGSGGLTVFWFLTALINYHCVISSCSILILWFSWLWMFSVSIVMPLVIAWRIDRRFSFTRGFRLHFSLRKRHSTIESSSHSVGSVEESVDSKEFPDYRESEMPEPESPKAPVKFSEEKLERLRRIPLSKFLTYPEGRESFRAFTVREFSVENLLFVEAVQAFKAKGTPTKADAKDLYNLYIIDSAPNQVNLPAATRQRLNARIEDADGLDLIELFNDAEEAIMKLMNRDAFKRYQKTSDWATKIVIFDRLAKPDPAKAEAAKTAEAPKTVELTVSSAGDRESSAATASMASENSVATPSAASSPPSPIVEVQAIVVVADSHSASSEAPASASEASGLPEILVSA